MAYPPNLAKLTFRLPARLLDSFKVVCSERHTTMQRELIDFIETVASKPASRLSQAIDNNTIVASKPASQLSQNSQAIEITAIVASKPAPPLPSSPKEVSPHTPLQESPFLPFPPESSPSMARWRVHFASWWQKCPHKIGKRAAEAAYERALKRGATPEQLLAGLERYIATKPADRPWCNPTTYLNQDRHLDEPAEPPLANGHDHRGWSERCSRCGCVLSEENRAKGRCRYCF